MVSIEKVPFAEGNLRRAYKMRDLTKTDGNDLFVAKMSKDKYEDIGVCGGLRPCAVALHRPGPGPRAQFLSGRAVSSGGARLCVRSYVTTASLS